MLADLKDDDQYYIIMEKVEGGELFDRIVALEAYSEEQARATSVVLLDALRYLHEQNIAHRGDQTRGVALIVSMGLFRFALQIKPTHVLDSLVFFSFTV